MNHDIASTGELIRLAIASACMFAFGIGFVSLGNTVFQERPKHYAGNMAFDLIGSFFVLVSTVLFLATCVAAAVKAIL